MGYLLLLCFGQAIEPLNKAVANVQDKVKMTHTPDKRVQIEVKPQMTVFQVVGGKFLYSPPGKVAVRRSHTTIVSIGKPRIQIPVPNVFQEFPWATGNRFYRNIGRQFLTEQHPCHFAVV